MWHIVIDHVYLLILPMDYSGAVVGLNHENDEFGQPVNGVFAEGVA